MRNSLLSAALLLGVIGVSSVSAAVVDQEFWTDSFLSVGFTDEDDNGPGIIRSICAQEFVPSLSGLVGVDLGLVRVNWATSDPADAIIYIREDSISGDIVTQTMLSGIQYDPNYGNTNIPMHVDFSETAWLEIGRTYVIEVYEVEMDTFAWRYSAGYPLGQNYQNGVPWGEDFLFRTYAVPEPLTMSLLSVGALALLRRKK